jgi:hypothetical protein
MCFVIFSPFDTHNLYPLAMEQVVQTLAEEEQGGGKVALSAVIDHTCPHCY